MRAPWLFSGTWCNSVVRQYGLYILMMAGVLVIQMIFAWGHLESLKELGWRDQPALGDKDLFQRVVTASYGAKIPLILFCVVAGAMLLFGTGLVADILFVMQWFLHKSQGRPFLASRRKRNGPWHIEDLIKLFVLFFFAVTCIESLLYIAVSGRILSVRVLDIILLVVNGAGVYGILLGALFFWKWKRDAGALFRRSVAWRVDMQTATKGFVTYIAFVPVLAVLLFVSIVLCQLLGIQPQPHDLVEILRREKSTAKLVYWGVLTVLMGPVMEEIIFRGVAYDAMRKRMGIYAAAAASAMIFALAHTNAAQTLPVFGMGMVLAILYEVTGSLIAPIAFHVVNNTFAFVLTMLVVSL